jgi:hypothetical protein
MRYRPGHAIIGIAPGNHHAGSVMHHHGSESSGMSEPDGIGNQRLVLCDGLRRLGHRKYGKAHVTPGQARFTVRSGRHSFLLGASGDFDTVEPDFGKRAPLNRYPPAWSTRELPVGLSPI